MSTKRLKASPKQIQRIIDIVLSDEKLVEYVISLVSKRLTTAMRVDNEWCNTVVDLSIDQVLNEVNIFELLGKLKGSKKTKIREVQSTKDDSPPLRPQFSSTEPKSVSAVSPRRMVKEMNKKKPIDLTNRPELSPLRNASANHVRPASFDRTVSVESDASTIPVVQPILDGTAILSRHIYNDASSNLESDNKNNSKNKDLLGKTLKHTDSESSISSEYEHDGMFESVNTSAIDHSHISNQNDFSVDASEESPKPRAYRGVVQEARSNEHKIHSIPHVQATAPTDSIDSLNGNISYSENQQYEFTNTFEPRMNVGERNGLTVSTSAVAEENEDFLSSWEKKVMEGMSRGDESRSHSSSSSASEDEGSVTMKCSGVFQSQESDGGVGDGVFEEDGGEWEDALPISGNAPVAVTTPATSVPIPAASREEREEEEDDNDEQEYSSDSSVSDSNITGSDYLSGAPKQNYSSSSGPQVLFFDQSRFDADADYFGADSQESSPGKSRKSRNGKKMSRKSKSENSARRVHFAPVLISDVRYRDRVGYAERAELFFTHNEEFQFSVDHSKEMERAEALGITWTQWIEERTDEDVQREEAAEADALAGFKLYTGDYYEEDERQVIPAELEVIPSGTVGTHGNAVAVQKAVHAVATTGTSTTNTASNSAVAGVNVNAGVHRGGDREGSEDHGIEVVFEDDLSVPSCSDDDAEYDFDDF